MRNPLARFRKYKWQAAVAVAGVVIVVVAVAGAWRYMGGSGGRGGGAPGAGGDDAGGNAGGTRRDGRADVAAMLDHINGTVVRRTEDFLYPAKSMVETTARGLNQYSSIRNDPYFERYVLDVLREYPQLDNFYIADRTGSRVMASSREEGKAETDVIDLSADEPSRVVKRWDASGKLLSAERHTQKELLADPSLGPLNSKKTGIYDASERPWYKQAVGERATCWSDVYIFSQSREPGITAACPVFSARKEMLFVVAADFEIKNISQFLAELNVGGGGLAFIINGREELIAYPEAGKILRIEDGKPVLARAEEVVPEWARAALRAWGKERRDVFAFNHAGRRYVASFAPFLERFGNDWKIVVVAPEDDLLDIGIDTRTR
ncbi:MAG: PDC sensor domain-containing protein [Planctomycetota bacterium]|jgi:hypothetical protein